ncbi:fasciclin domain-containing protein [Actinoplanes sp. N902-109]|uniref:fasciclin domain-containing protein n=1 Tax=Actinoplanes sp. (strain N902-109) TaxID=649831 RepID=UPI00032957C0|nr:fasciclin domain-containing protein [Actinoplanes sp. N902-109]AGL19141.1 beta-Ig-H3/fasciclin [Actinoplanes sp. N902-109]
MRLGRTTTRLLTGLTATAAVLAPSAAAHASAPQGTRSLAQVLAGGGAGFDHNPYDFDILTAAVGAVLKAKPGSPVAVLADGGTALTAFLPTDRAFENLARELTGAGRLPAEKQAFGTVAGLGIDTVEGVLLYHVVPGATINRKTAVKANGTKLTTAAGGTVTVRVTGRCLPRVTLRDADPSDRDPRVVRFDINKGNRQIAHAIDAVLRPADLP